ncbi:MAG: DUF1844 domain-containing protein [Planctomycetes bacterium]|nr:DUF1844 domain-containing protein [Planctomycetota bacterium]
MAFGEADPLGATEKPEGGESSAFGKMRRDESWKDAAQKEKEKLEKDLKSAPQREVPQASFTGLLYDLSMQAMLALGLVATQGQEEPVIDLPLARYTIDTLAVLEEKTKGNLTAEESAYLSQLLQSLRLRFVEAARVKS